MKMDSTLLSVFGLCATNSGNFKSEKQANFFARKFGNEINAVESYAFGQNNGCRRSVTYTVKFDSTGITSVVKTGAKQEVTFQRGTDTNAYLKNAKKKQHNQELLRQEVIQIEVPYVEGRIEELTAVRKEIVANIPSTSMIFASMLAEVDQELASNVARLNKLKLEFDL
jgi:hypothetical protein